MIALLGAMREELSGITKDLTGVREISHHSWRLVEGDLAGKRLLVMQTGVGKTRAIEAVQYLQQNYSLSMLISIGFGGALARGYKRATW